MPTTGPLAPWLTKVTVVTAEFIVTAVGVYSGDMLLPIFLELPLNSGHVLRVLQDVIHIKEGILSQDTYISIINP